MSLSSTLSDKIRKTLIRCPQFQTHARLRALFINELIAPWRDEVQDAQSPSERVDLLVALLLDRKDTQGKSALVLFLRVLGEAQPQGDALHDEVLALVAELKTPLPSVPRLRPSTQPQSISMIDREDAVTLFRQMLEPTPHVRVLRLIGSENMGKSHLLRVFREIAIKDHHALCPLVDMRATTLSYSDILHTCSQQLSIPMPNYQAAQDELTRQWEKNTGTLSQLLSKFSGGEKTAETSRHERHRLTAAFVQDLRALPASMAIVLLFDTVEQASTDIQTWVTNDLLAALYPLTHVRVVLAGRQLPAISTTWQDICHPYELQPVKPYHYRHYCETLGLTLNDGELNLIYQMWDGSPGLLVSMTPKLLSWGSLR